MSISSASAPAGAVNAWQAFQGARRGGRTRDLLSLDDFEAAARRTLPRPIFGYVSGAAEDNRALDDNRRAFDELAFVPRVLCNVAQRQQQVTLFGTTYASPFGIAPMGIAALSAYRGDVVLARAAAHARIPAVLSGSSLIRLETVMEAAPDTWFQAYLPGTPERIDALLAARGRGRRARRWWSRWTSRWPATARTTCAPASRRRCGRARAWPGTASSARAGCWARFLRTLARHGMPHFENSFAERGAPILSSRGAARLRRARPLRLEPHRAHPPPVARGRWSSRAS